jgi:hypothetical protein
VYEIAFSHEIFRNATPDQASLAACFRIIQTAQRHADRWPHNSALALLSRRADLSTHRAQTASLMPESVPRKMLLVESGIAQRRAATALQIALLSSAMKKIWWRGLIEVGFIIFLFYSNLLMGEFERTGWGSQRGVEWALWDTFTVANLAIALVAAVIGYILFEFLRTKF